MDTKELSITVKRKKNCSHYDFSLTTTFPPKNIPGLEITTFTKRKTQIIYFQALHDYKHDIPC